MDAVQLDNDGRSDVTLALWPPAPAPPPRADPALETRLEHTLSRLSLEDKVGQVIQADIGSVTPDDVREYRLGSILNGGNAAPGGDMRAPPSAWLEAADAFWEASMDASGSGVPVVWGSDAVHGNSNVAGATIFPHAINLGAACDLDLAERIGAATALEMAVTGLDWTFAPTLAVAQDVRWGRTYESFSVDPALVAKLGASLIRGLQGAAGTADFLGPGRVVATAKHFVGDGGTRDGRDQGETRATEAELRDIHAASYRSAIEAGVQSIMVSFSSWGGRKLHGRADLLTGLLKQRWGFDGVVVGDWNGHGQLPGATTERCPEALIAGLDMYMAPDSWRGLFYSTLDALRSGLIPQHRLDDAVRRILRMKLRAGLFDKPKPSRRPFAGCFDLLAGPKHLQLAHEAVRKSAVLLKNESGLLPLRANQRILVAGDGADDLSCQCGGWTLSWQGQGLERTDFPAGETVLDGVKRVVQAAGGSVEHAPDGAWSTRPDAAIVVLAEEPYAEFRGDLETLDYKPGRPREYDLLRKLRADGVTVAVVLLSGRPLWVNPALNASHAFVAAFLPGTQAGALADLLFENPRASIRHDFEGRLPFAWPLDPDRPGGPALFDVGFGLSLAQAAVLASLHERSAASSADPRVLFDLGVAQGGWTLYLEDAAGAQASGQAVQSPGGALRARAADLGKQENAIAVNWSGRGSGRLVLRHAAIDLTRDVNADCCLALRCLTCQEAPRGLGVRIHFRGDGSRVVRLEIAASAKEPTLIEIPLKAFGDDAHWTEVEAIEIEADAALELTIAKLSVSPMSFEACTAAAVRCTSQSVQRTRT